MPAADDNASTLPIRGKDNDQSSGSSPSSGVVMRGSRGRTNEFVSLVYCPFIEVSFFKQFFPDLFGILILVFRFVQISAISVVIVMRHLFSTVHLGCSLMFVCFPENPPRFQRGVGNPV